MKQISSLKKIFLSILLIFAFCIPVFSLPGYTELLPTESGEYVYYKDFSFAQETYLGFLYYDEHTIAVRCFSNGKFDVQILFSLDDKKDYLELTGEKILSEITPNDVEIVNYIHDMLYEFSARRKKVQNEFDLIKEQNLAVNKQFVSSQDFVQFGGQVQLVFDGSLPVFNLESITDIYSAKVLLKAVTMGTLSDNADTGFEKFAGFENIPEKKEVVKKKKLSKKEQKALDAKIQKYDSLWKLEDSMPGEFKTLGDYAIFWKFPLEIVRDTSTNENSKQVFDYFSRNNRLSSNGTYVYLPESSVNVTKNANGNFVQVSKMIVYNPEANKYSVNYKFLIEENGNFKMINFVVYESWLNQNQDYVDYFLSLIK